MPSLKQTFVFFFIFFTALPALSQAAQTATDKIKVIVDQDARGPCSTDMQSILMFVQSPDVEVLGITLVSGDQWVKEQTQRTLRALEIAGRTDIPVVPGAEFPLINSKEESELWEKRFGRFGFKGAWTPRFYHPPDVVPELAEGSPTTRLNSPGPAFIHSISGPRGRREATYVTFSSRRRWSQAERSS